MQERTENVQDPEHLFVEKALLPFLLRCDRQGGPSASEIGALLGAYEAGSGQQIRSYRVERAIRERIALAEQNSEADAYSVNRLVAALNAVHQTLPEASVRFAFRQRRT